MENLEEKCDSVYNHIADLSGEKPHLYTGWYGGHKIKYPLLPLFFRKCHIYDYSVLINKDKTKQEDNKWRKKSWRNFLVDYFKLDPMGLGKTYDFNSHYWNSFISSGYRIYDQENDRIVEAYTPWYSFLFKPFVGGNLIVVKSKQFFTPQVAKKPVQSVA